MATTTPLRDTATEPPANAGRARSRAIIALLLLVPAPTLGVIAALFIWPDTALGQGLYNLAKLWILILPILWLWRIDKQKIRMPRWSWRGMPAGLITGLITIAAIVGAWELFASNWVDTSVFKTKMQEIGLDTPLMFIGFAVAMSLINALLEEYVWRWFVYSKFNDLLEGPAKAIVVSGAIVLAGLAFMLHHTVAMSLYFDWKSNLLASIGVFAGGVTWSIIYLRYKNIYAGYVSHILADFALFYVGYRIAFGS